MRTPTITAGCMDCNRQSFHPTTTEANTELFWHGLENPNHRPLIADAANGWHRAWVDLDQPNNHPARIDRKEASPWLTR